MNALKTVSVLAIAGLLPAAAQATVIDDFESGDLSPYTTRATASKTSD